MDYIPFWQETFTKPDDPMYDFASRIVNAKKVVFTKTLDKVIWDKTELAKGDLTYEINRLKNQDGKDIIVYGGSSFVSALTSAGLIDAFHFFINPIAIGNGTSAFNQLENWQPLKLVKSITCNSGIIILNYERK